MVRIICNHVFRKTFAPSWSTPGSPGDGGFLFFPGVFPVDFGFLRSFGAGRLLAISTPFNQMKRPDYTIMIS
jgi:hypothetical protein